jgi:eukaryotic-like serine/threonine-protein kinase
MNDSLQTPRPTLIPPDATKPHRFGDYDLLTSIGHGGMGEVFLARASHASPDDPLVALKVLLSSVNKNKDAITMFMDEAAIMTQIHHPNILEVFSFGKEEGRYYLAMEYLQGQSLANCILDTRGKNQSLTYAQVAAIGAGTARGLSSAHSAVGREGQPLNVVHRDVTPQNVFLTYTGRAKVIDFGIARASERLTQTMVGMYKGKAAYMAPEQIDMEAPDARADVFALGVCLWEMITQKRLFLRDTPVECLQAILQAEIESPTQIAGEHDALLDEIVFNALERDLAFRTQSAKAVEEALVSYLRTRTQEYEEIIIQELLRDLYRDVAAEEARLLDRLLAGGSPQSSQNKRLQEISGIAPSLAPNRKRVMTLAGQVDERETMVVELTGVRDTMPCKPRQSIVDHLRHARTESVHKAVQQLSVQLPTKEKIPIVVAVAPEPDQEPTPAAPVLEDPVRLKPDFPWFWVGLAGVLVLLMVFGYAAFDSETGSTEIEATSITAPAE